MASIKIREIDNTGSSGLAPTNNTVYIPGLAKIGPVDYPVYVESVEEFNYWFGEDNFDSSALYARELLGMGLPVLFQRVEENDAEVAALNRGTASEGTASSGGLELKVQLTSPGVWGDNYRIRLQKYTYTEDEGGWKGPTGWFFGVGVEAESDTTTPVDGFYLIADPQDATKWERVNIDSAPYTGFHPCIYYEDIVGLSIA